MGVNMAKQLADEDKKGPPGEEKEPSARTLKMITALRRPFLAYTHDLSSITSKRSEIVPQFEKAWTAYNKETGASFVAFVRVLDPSVPEDRAGYRKHRVYQAAAYIRRVATAPARSANSGPRPASPLVAFSRLLATVHIDENLWAAFQHEMHWTPKFVQKIDKLAKKLGPVSVKRRRAA